MDIVDYQATVTSVAVAYWNGEIILQMTAKIGHAIAGCNTVVLHVTARANEDSDEEDNDALGRFSVMPDMPDLVMTWEATPTTFSGLMQAALAGKLNRIEFTLPALLSSMVETTGEIDSISSEGFDFDYLA